MIKPVTRIPVQFEVLEGADLRFAPVKAWICHVGENLNKSFFSVDALEELKKSLGNNPILGYIQVDEANTNDYKGHENVITISDNGVNMKYLGRAYGVVPENHNAKFESKVCDDGIERTFLTCEALMWRKFPEAIEILERDGFKGQSMELQRDSIKGRLEDGLFYFDSASIEGLCLLGDDYVPAMTGALVETFSMAGLKEQMKEMLVELQLYSQRGDEMSDFALTNEQLVNEMHSILRAKEEVESSWGDNICRYWYIDHDDDYIYAQDYIEGWHKVFGFSYAIEGDTISVDFESKKRMKITYEPMGEAEQDNFELALQRTWEMAKEATEADIKEKAATEYAEKEAKLNTELETLKSEHNILEDEVDKLNEYKANKIAQEHKEAVEDMFAKFSNELTDEDVAEIKDTALDMSLDELENVLYVLVGKKKATFTAPIVKPKNRITITTPTDDNTGGKSWGNLVQTIVGKK